MLGAVAAALLLLAGCDGGSPSGPAPAAPSSGSDARSSEIRSSGVWSSGLDVPSSGSGADVATGSVDTSSAIGASASDALPPGGPGSSGEPGASAPTGIGDAGDEGELG